MSVFLGATLLCCNLHFTVSVCLSLFPTHSLLFIHLYLHMYIYYIGGNLFILIGSHIGISNSFQLGKFSRMGQTCDGTACGAAVHAYDYCNNCANPRPTAEDLGNSPDDYQMKYIISQLYEKIERINGMPDENARQAELAKQTYEIAQVFLDKVVNTEFGDKNGKLIILGGVQVNMPRPMPDYFMPMKFEIRQHGKPTIDILKKAFGHIEIPVTEAPRVPPIPPAV